MASPPLLTALRDGRKQRSLSLAKAAALTGLNLSQIENGRVDPRLSSVIALAGMLDMVLVAVPRTAAAQVQSLAASGALSAMPSVSADPPSIVDALRVPNAARTHGVELGGHE
jgi:transcriptional regulator with XRE-family HTH domain